MKRKKLFMMYISLGLLAVLMAVVLIQRLGIQEEQTDGDSAEVPAVILSQKKQAEELKKESLIIIDDDEPGEREEQLAYVLESMGVGVEYLSADRLLADGLPSMDGFKTVILNTTETEIVSDSGWLDELMKWVENGGRLWSALPDVGSGVFQEYPDAFGIDSMEIKEVTISSIEMQTDFMIGSYGFVYDLEDYPTYGLDVTLTEQATVHALQKETSTPVIWEKDYGEGRVVVNNVDLLGKASRGILAAQYSLLEDVFAYPVINSSVFFIDDFPAPFPEGWEEHITEHYDMDIDTFFSSVWLPDTMELAEKYGIPFTNVLIITYTDDTHPPYDATVDKETFSFFGSLMKQNGGEIGYHGYNHQPLVLDGFEFTEDLGYMTWASVEDIHQSLRTLVDTTEWVFPNETASVYVPPSNILSDEAREVIGEEIEEIDTIASLYTVTGNEYEQEFEVAEDGTVELPRTISGLELSEYDRWMVLNELNFHFVNSHFFHPDDLLDEDRGADKGWDHLKGTFEDYLMWLEDIAPGLRKQKASDASKSVQRYDSATIERSFEDEDYVVTIDNFYDEMYCLVRISKGKVDHVEGGMLTPLTSDLYLLKADSEKVTIHFADPVSERGE